MSDWLHGHPDSQESHAHRCLVFLLNFSILPARGRFADSRELNIKCVSWCTRVCIRVHRHTSLNCAHRSLNQPIVVTFVQLFGVTLQFLVPEQLDTVKDVLLFLVQHFGIHFHCLFVIHRCHWLRSVRVWRLCYSAEHTVHQHSAYVTVLAVRTVART